MKQESRDSKKFILIFFLVLGFLSIYFSMRETPENKSLKKHLEQIETTVHWYDIKVPQYQSAVINHNLPALPNIDQVVSEYGRNYLYSQKALVSQLVYDGYDVDKSIKSVKKSNVSWYENCLEIGTLMRNDYHYTKFETADILIQDGFDSKTILKVVKELYD